MPSWSVEYAETVTIIVAVTARDAFQKWRAQNEYAGRGDVIIRRLK